MDIKSKLQQNGISVSNIEETRDSVVITGSSKYSDEIANLNILYRVAPDGRIDGKDVMMKLDESESCEEYRTDLFEATPHPSLIEEGDRITINHKTFGQISVVVAKIKRWSRDNELDGVYWRSVKKGIFGFCSFDNIIRYYKYT